MRYGLTPYVESKNRKTIKGHLGLWLPLNLKFVGKPCLNESGRDQRALIPSLSVLVFDRWRNLTKHLAMIIFLSYLPAASEYDM